MLMGECVEVTNYPTPAKLAYNIVHIVQVRSLDQNNIRHIFITNDGFRIKQKSY